MLTALVFICYDACAVVVTQATRYIEPRPASEQDGALLVLSEGEAMSASQRIQVPYAGGLLEVQRVTMADSQALVDWCDLFIRGDYFFQKKHLTDIIKRASSATWAVLYQRVMVGMLVIHKGTILHNLYLQPEVRSTGIGTALIEFFHPEVVRAKSNMVAGDPVPFYEKNGYVERAKVPGKEHIVIMDRSGFAGPRPPSPAPVSGSAAAGSGFAPVDSVPLCAVDTTAQPAHQPEAKPMSRTALKHALRDANRLARAGDPVKEAKYQAACAKLRELRADQKRRREENEQAIQAKGHVPTHSPAKAAGGEAAAGASAAPAVALPPPAVAAAAPAGAALNGASPPLPAATSDDWRFAT